MDKQATKKDIQNLKYWLDTEITLLHIGFAILIGLIVKGKVWWFVGIYIAISTIYMFIKAKKLPSGYLK